MVEPNVQRGLDALRASIARSVGVALVLRRESCSNLFDPPMRSSAILALFLVAFAAPACDPTCNAPHHVGLVLLGQSNVLECGPHRVTDSAASVDAFLLCVNDAIRARRPFRAQYNIGAFSRGTGEFWVLGRVANDTFEVFSISSVDTHSVNPKVFAIRCDGPAIMAPTMVSPRASDLEVKIDCTFAPGSPAGTPYSPPTLIRNGRLCGNDPTTP